MLAITPAPWSALRSSTDRATNARAHVKTHHRFERMRLRGLSGSLDEFHLAAIVQNLKTLAKHIWRRMPHEPVACVA